MEEVKIHIMEAKTSLDMKIQSVRQLSLKILRQEPISVLEWHQLITTAHTICFHDDNSEQMYHMLQDEILSTVIDAKIDIFAFATIYHETGDDETFLKAYNNEWKKYFRACTYLPQPFPYMPETEIPDFSGVRNFMLETWDTNIFSEIKICLRKSVGSLIEKERRGEVSSSQLIIDLRDSYVNLCRDGKDPLFIYRELFENDYVAGLRVFYGSEAPAYLVANGVHCYMKYAELRLREEEVRAEKYLEVSSRQMVRKICADVLLAPFTGAAEIDLRQKESENMQGMFEQMSLS